MIKLLTALTLSLVTTFCSYKAMAVPISFIYPTQYTDNTSLKAVDIDKAEIRAVCDGKTQPSVFWNAPKVSGETSSTAYGNCVFDVRVIMKNGVPGKWSTKITKVIKRTPKAPAWITKSD